MRVDQRGSALVSTLIAAGIIALSIGGVALTSVQLQRAMKKTEIANLAVVTESHLIKAFHDKSNFPDPTAGGAAVGLNATLRSGNLPATMTLNTPFGILNLTPSPAGTELSASGFMTRTMAPCPAFDNNCVLRFEVRLRKVPGSIASYAFAYQIDVNQDIIQTAPMGDIQSYSSPIDPGLYRAEQLLTKCNSADDLFMTGMNRDTGEAFCVAKPPTNSCPKGKVPKGLEYIKYTDQEKAGTLKLKCTENDMRTFNCPANYALQIFQPPYADPDNTAFGTTVPGICVFRTSHDATMRNTIPADPTSPYLRSIAASVCPPFYAASNASACQLVPNTARNSNPAEGLGKCGTTQYKNCTRATWTDTTASDGGRAFTAWSACMASPPPPPASCGSAPANPIWFTVRTCSFTENSTFCNGVPDTSTSCSTRGSWSGGTPYAASITTVAPTATTVVSFSGRRVTCSFRDTSTPCTAPDVDFSGSTYGKKDPKWYGGVKVTGAQCTYDSTYGSETVSAF